MVCILELTVADFLELTMADVPELTVADIQAHPMMAFLEPTMVDKQAPTLAGILDLTTAFGPLIAVRSIQVLVLKTSQACITETTTHKTTSQTTLDSSFPKRNNLPAI